jgi:hypothetical protein
MHGAQTYGTEYSGQYSVLTRHVLQLDVRATEEINTGVYRHRYRST